MGHTPGTFGADCSCDRDESVYKKILTADYTMVNPISNIAYRSGVEFEVDYLDASGVYSKQSLNTFKPGRNRGHIPHDEQFHFDYGARILESFSDYQSWPHAGVLSTHAWLARYPLRTPTVIELVPDGLTLLSRR